MKIRKITPKQFKTFTEMYQRVKERALILCEQGAKEEKITMGVEFTSFEIEEDGYMRISALEGHRNMGNYWEEHSFYFDIEEVCDLD